MLDEPGATTQDILALGQEHPAEKTLQPDDRENRTQRRGNRYFRSGLTVLVCAPIAALLLALATDGPTFVNLVSACFGLLSLIALITLGAVLTMLGGTERLHRPQRAMSRQALLFGTAAADRMDDMAHAIDLIAKHLPEDQQIREWRGFSAAVREGLTERTGTEGPPAPRQRISHLNVIRRDDATH